MLGQKQLALFRQGNNDSLSEAFEKEFPALVIYAYSFVQNKDTAADIVVMLFEKLLSYSTQERQENLPEEVTHFERLIYTIVKNKCLDHLKVNKNRLRILNAEVKPSSNGHAEAETEKLFVTEAFHALKEQLGARQKEVLELHLQGFDSSEIEEKLAISRNTVQNTLNNSKKKVKTLWKDFFES
jgi:RNA polymerase sigma factor (sigma-70 family)